ncbi:MAG: iron exporter MbfA [Hyphomicrobiales bacterium]
MKSLAELTESEVLALAIANEEEDSRIYQTFAEKLRKEFPASARIFDEMAEEERSHRSTLYDAYRERFGEHLPPIRREDVRGFLKRRSVWMLDNLGRERMVREAEVMELQAANFYDKAAEQTQDVAVRRLFVHLAEVERGHENRALEAENRNLTGDARAAEKEADQRIFLLQYVQPGLVGLMDGSVSTLAPLFAAAFATRENWPTFLVGLAAAIGAGISMGFAEALSDDGRLTGRGSPLTRGIVCGLMTTFGGVFHSLPYLVPQTVANAFLIATSIAAVIVVIELCAISWIRARYMDTPLLKAAFQVVVGGFLVFLAGILIGSA